MITIEMQLSDWLKLLKVPVSIISLRERLYSHPFFPSLLSIEDTLGEFGVQIATLKIGQADLIHIPVPFVAHIPGNPGTEFVLVTEVSVLLKNEEFMKKKDAVVLVVKKIKRGDKTDSYYTDKDRRSLLNYAKIVLFTFIGLSVISLLTHFSFLDIGILITAWCGIFLSVLVFQKEMGETGIILEKLCKLNQFTDCSSVLRSKGSKIFGDLTLADLSYVYFSWFLIADILLAIAPSTGPSILGWFSVLSVFSILFVIYSIIYQFAIVKKICILCIGIDIVLVLQFFLLFPFFSFPQSLHANFLLIVQSLVFSAGSYFPGKILLTANRRLSAEKFSFLTLRRDPEVFLHLLYKQNSIPFDKTENEFYLGQHDAPLQLLIVSSLQCEFCFSAIHKLSQLIEKEQGRIALTIRFLIDYQEPMDKRKKVLELILRKNDAPDADKMEILEDWFSWRNYEKFSFKYGSGEYTGSDAIFFSYQKWMETLPVTTVPAIFINRYPLPEFYTTDELCQFVPALIDHFTSMTG